MGDFLYGVAEFFYPIVVLAVIIAIPLWIGKKIAKWATKDAPQYEDDGKGGLGANIMSNNYKQGH